MREIITTIMISSITTTNSNCVLRDGVPIGIEGVGDVNISLAVSVGSKEDADKDTNDRTFVVDELDDIKLIEVVVNDDNMLLVLEMISYEMRRLVVSDIKG